MRQAQRGARIAVRSRHPVGFGGFVGRSVMRWAVFNQKGGVGKSTIACNLAAVSASGGRRTLVVEPRSANSSHYLLGVDVEAGAPTWSSSSRGLSASSCFAKAPGVHSPHPLRGPPHHAGRRRSRGAAGEARGQVQDLQTADALDELDGYDAIFLDTPPAFGFYTLSALIAADRCLIPFDCDDFSRRALYGLLRASTRSVRTTTQSLESAVSSSIRFQARARLPQRLVEELKSEGLPVLEPFMSASVKCANPTRRRSRCRTWRGRTSSRGSSRSCLPQSSSSEIEL